MQKNRYLTPEYREKLERGLAFQDFVTQLLYREGLPVIGFASRDMQFEQGENLNGFEIKLDDRMQETGNVYFEVAEKSSPDKTHYAASGIFRNDNAWLYIIGDYQTLYICGKKALQRFYREQVTTETKARLYCGATSKGLIVPQPVVEAELAERTIHIE